MKTFRASGRYLIGWLVVAMAGMGEAPRLYGDGDPSCPTCSQNGPMSAHESPTLGLPPHHGLPHQGLPAYAAPHLETPIEVPLEEAPAPMVRLKIRVPACAEVGKELEYRIKVENTSPADAHNVIVRMSLPASVKVLRASPQIHQREPELQWNLGTMPGHGCHDIVVMIVPLGLADIKSCTRVTFEHGQCVTTKVMAFAPEGSADGKTPPGVIPGGPGSGLPGGPKQRAAFEVLVDGPKEAKVGEPTKYTIIIFNKGDRPISDAGVALTWDIDLEEALPLNQEIARAPGVPNQVAWPRGGGFKVIEPNRFEKLELILKARKEGRLCIKATATADMAPNSHDEACTQFSRDKIAGMSLEMTDSDDPILKNGRTSYPITVRNQGGGAITNLQIIARVPDMLELDRVDGPGRYKKGLDLKKGGFWVEFEPLAVLAPGKTERFEIFVNAKGIEGDARFHVEMTADQLDKGPGGAQRWIIEEESTTIVADEETRARIREISRKARERKVVGTVTGGK